MSTTLAAVAKRTRPEDGGVLWHEALNAFECLGCTEFEEVRSAARRTPERLAALRELLVLEHTECWEYADPRMAFNARRFRKEAKRRKLLEENRARLARRERRR